MASKRTMSIAEMLNDSATPPSTPQAKRRRVHSRTVSKQSQGTPCPAPVQAAANKHKGLSLFTTRETVGRVAYPVYQTTDLRISQQHRRFCLYPEDDIQAFPYHVAFSSDKRGFFSQTGRNGFEVFKYTFKYTEPSGPDNEKRSLVSDKEWDIMWDYNIGLVRIANLFKWQSKYLKTMPHKAIHSTDGLDDLCHNITGGKTDCQGFWMPYEAAKAVAATFCYKIRYALTPMFGQDFVDLCYHPDDPLFQSYAIGQDIVRRCAAQAETWRRLAKSYKIQPKREQDDISTAEQSPVQREARASTPLSAGAPRSLRSRHKVSYAEGPESKEPTADASLKPHLHGQQALSFEFETGSVPSMIKNPMKHNAPVKQIHTTPDHSHLNKGNGRNLQTWLEEREEPDSAHRFLEAAEKHEAACALLELRLSGRRLH